MVSASISDMTQHFTDDQHALLTGMLIGQLIKAGFVVMPQLDDEDNFTPFIAIRIDPDVVLDVLIEVKGLS